MTKTKALSLVSARLDVRGRVVWRDGLKPNAADRIALLGYWPQLRRAGRQTLDPQEARAFLDSLGFIALTAPRYIEELGLVLEAGGDMGTWTHPMGDEYAATLADDILEGRLAVPTLVTRANRERAKAQREADAFAHGRRRRGHTTITHQNRRTR